MHSTVWTTQRYSQSYTEKRRRSKETGGQEDKGGNQKEREIQPVISSLSVLHSPEHTKRFTELGREEKRKEGDRGDLGAKKKSQREREQSSQ